MEVSESQGFLEPVQNGDFMPNCPTAVKVKKPTSAVNKSSEKLDKLFWTFPEVFQSIRRGFCKQLQ